MKPIKAFFISFLAGLTVLASGHGAFAPEKVDVIGVDGRRSIPMA
jgi:hypothetical protein